MDQIQKKRTTRGRQKIAIAKIEKENDRYATFSKRRQGMFKKASELSTLCDADVGLFILSPTGKPFSFFHPSMEAVLSRFRLGGDEEEVEEEEDDDDASRLVEAFSRTRVMQLNQMSEMADEEMDEEVEREKQLEEVVMKRENWWDEPVENLDKEQLEQRIALLQNLQSELRSHRQSRLNCTPNIIRLD